LPGSSRLRLLVARLGLSVRELQAMLAVRKGDTKRAKELWNEIAKDPAVPQGTSQRVTAMLNLHGGAEAK